MASKILLKDLSNLQIKYKNRIKYFDSKINNNYDPLKDKKFFAQYSFYLKAYRELVTLLTIYERTFNANN